jgi:hypothetical protein
MSGPRIRYVDLDAMDAAMRREMQRCAAQGTPRPKNSAVRAQVPACFWSFANAWQAIFRERVCDHALKALCRFKASPSYWARRAPATKKGAA